MEALVLKLSILNKQPLGKWLWRFASESEPLWKRVNVGKYGKERGRVCRDGFGLGCGRSSEGASSTNESLSMWAMAKG